MCVSHGYALSASAKLQRVGIHMGPVDDQLGNCSYYYYSPRPNGSVNIEIGGVRESDFPQMQDLKLILKFRTWGGGGDHIF